MAEAYQQSGGVGIQAADHGKGFDASPRKPTPEEYRNRTLKAQTPEGGNPHRLRASLCSGGTKAITGVLVGVGQLTTSGIPNAV